MKAIFAPSGDHAGDWLDFLALVNWRAAPVRAIGQPDLGFVGVVVPVRFANRVHIQRPSGEISGEPTRFSDRI